MANEDLKVPFQLPHYRLTHSYLLETTRNPETNCAAFTVPHGAEIWLFRRKGLTENTNKFEQTGPGWEIFSHVGLIWLQCHTPGSLSAPELISTHRTWMLVLPAHIQVFFNWSALGPPSAEPQQALWDHPGLTSLPTLTNGSPQRAAGTWERRLLRSFASGFLA